MPVAGLRNDAGGRWRPGGEGAGVQISAKTQYACLAVLELACRFGSGEPVRVGQIAQTHGIPARFLVQILLQLKGAGMVASTRGVSGGYHLTRDPATLTLAEVMAAVEGQRQEVTGSSARQTAAARVLLSVWNDVARVEHAMLAETSFARLVERIHEESPHMYFI